MISPGRTCPLQALMTNMLRISFNAGEPKLMFSLRKACATAVAVLAIVVLSSAFCHAAKKSTGGKLYVPSNIIKGSAISAGRAFYASNLPEQTLAGIKLGRPAKEILAKWGNPSRITLGTVSSEGAPAPTGPAYIPPARSPYEALTGAVGNLYGAPGPGDLLPPLSPGQAPMTPAPSGGTTPVLTQEEVTWTYDLPNGITLEFIITDGLITQITTGGVGPWRLSKTRTGLQLGDTYKLVLWVCGYPESQEYAGRFLRTRYVNKNRALFTFLRNKLVGITIALVPQELQ